MDLSGHEQVKIVFVFGESDRFKIIPHPKLKIIHLMAEELNGTVDPFMQKVGMKNLVLSQTLFPRMLNFLSDYQNNRNS